MIAQQRDAAGRVTLPHTLVWTCSRCLKDFGRTVILRVDMGAPSGFHAETKAGHHAIH